MEEGDELIIPRSSDTVSVVGEVRQPGTHIFQAGLSVEDYISLSAGVTKDLISQQFILSAPMGRLRRLTRVGGVFRKQGSDA